MRITARLIIRFYSARGRNWQGRAHRANVTNMHQTKTVEKFGKDSPTVFIYRFSGIPASSYPRCSIKRSSENVSKSIECSNARSMDTRHSFKAFYASIQYGVPVVHSSLQHCKLYVFIQLTAQITDFLEDQQISLEKSRYKANCGAHSAKVQVQTINQFVLWPFTAKTHSATFEY